MIPQAPQLVVVRSEGLPALLYRKNTAYRRNPWASSGPREEWRYVCTIGPLDYCKVRMN